MAKPYYDWNWALLQDCLIIAVSNPKCTNKLSHFLPRLNAVFSEWGSDECLINQPINVFFGSSL